MHAKIIACQVFVEELRSLLPGDVEIDTLPMSLHERPRSLRESLQERVDASADCDEAVRERWETERAERVRNAMLGRYRRLARLRTGSEDEALTEERAKARATTARFGLRYDEIEGSRELVYPLLYGPWDERFLVVRKGGTIRLAEFLCTGGPRPG